MGLCPRPGAASRRWPTDVVKDQPKPFRTNDFLLLASTAHDKTEAGAAERRYPAGAVLSPTSRPRSWSATTRSLPATLIEISPEGAA